MEGKVVGFFLNEFCNGHSIFLEYSICLVILHSILNYVLQYLVYTLQVLIIC